jgi:hypothetical protein
MGTDVFIDRLYTCRALCPSNKAGHNKKGEEHSNEKSDAGTDSNILKQIYAEGLMKPI